MKSAWIKQRRDRDRKREIADFLILVSSFLSMPLFLAFWIADLFYVPELKWEFLALRLLIVPFGIATNFLIKRSKTLFQVQSLGAIFIFANSSIITTMVYLADGIASPYYAGLNLVCTGLIFLPWNTKFLIFNFFLIYAPYYLAAPFAYENFEQLSALIIHTFFIVGTVIASTVMRNAIEKLRMKELENRILLRRELTNRQKIINEKTAEAIRLTTLTKQFSPQVVHAIRSGNIDLQATASNQNICSIFIDIVSSTEKIDSIPLESHAKAISMFMDDTMKVLLKYDITIDKFLGDGVLGFCNAPIAYSDYVERTVSAGLEVLYRLEMRQTEYTKVWGERLDLRIGIAEGNANIGFYGSDESVKSFTAIGPVVNLANRFCSHGTPNQIVTHKQVIDKLPPDNYLCQAIDPTRLKGFREEFQLYEILPDHEETELDDDIELCPHGHGVLHLNVNAKGIYLFLCRTCGYEHDPAADDDDVIAA